MLLLQENKIKYCQYSEQTNILRFKNTKILIWISKWSLWDVKISIAMFRIVPYSLIKYANTFVDLS